MAFKRKKYLDRQRRCQTLLPGTKTCQCTLYLGHVRDGLWHETPMGTGTASWPGKTPKPKE